MPYQLPPPSDEDQFENLVRDILRRVYRDPGIERFGRKGQAQFGVDGISPAHSGVTFQCKLKDTRYAPDDQIRTKLLSEMEEEFSKTKGRTEPPTRFIFASTFKNDRALQEKAQSLSSTTTIVEYLGWDTINERIWEYAEELIPLYYSAFDIKPVPGFRQITTQLIEESRTISDQQKTLLAVEYYRINDRADVVFQVVCNDMDVRNTKVMNEIHDRLQMLPASATLWLVGAGGSGKTTILYRTATELAQQDHVVFTLDLEADLGRSDLETILALIKQRSVESCMLCIDNPAADEETLETLLRELPNYTSKIHVILAERAHRYRALRNTGALTYLHGEEDLEPINVRNPRNQREGVYRRLFTLLNVSDEDTAPLLDIVRNESLVYVNATYRILLELKKKRRIDFDFDWDDYRKTASDLPAFREGYKYIALFYLFGVRTPFSTFSRLCGADEAQRRLFVENFRGLVNEPIVIDERRNDTFQKAIYLRTKHEIVSDIFFREHPEINKEELVMEWGESTKFDNPIEAQALINIFGAKKNYFSDAAQMNLRTLTDFLLEGYIKERVELSPKLYATLHLAKAWLLLNEGQIREAIDTLKFLLQRQPDNLHCRVELARIYQDQGRIDDAEETLRETLRIESDDVQAHTELAMLYQKQGRLAEAEALMLRVLRLKPNDLNARTELARIFQKQGKLEESEELLLQVLDLSQNDLYSRTELAKVYRRQGRLNEAESVLLKLLSIERRSIWARTELAKVWQRQNRLGEAERLLLEVLEISRSDLNARTELSKIYQRQGKLIEAEGVLTQLLQLEPKDLQARTELAKIYQRQGKLDAATRRLEEYIALDPKGLHPRTELAKIYQRQGKLKEAEELLLESLAIDDKQLHPRTELARIYQRQGKLKEAEDRLLESLAIDHKQLHPRTELAKIYQRQGKLKEAEERLLESLAIDHKQLHPRTELAKIYQRQGKLKEAEDVLMELLRLEPDDLQARTELAKIYQRQGKLDLAAQYAEESLLIDPLNDHAMSELLAVWTRQGEGEKAAQRFIEFIDQTGYNFTRSSQAPVFRFFQCCRRFGMQDDARLVYQRFQSQLDERNVELFDNAFGDT